MIKMENDVLSVEIAEHGAELTKLYNKKTGTDLLPGMQNSNGNGQIRPVPSVKVFRLSQIKYV